MRFLIQCFLLLSFSLATAAQDSAILISPSMFDKTREQVFIAPIDGWIFKAGNDAAWASKNIATNGWKKVKPTELNTSYADKTGRVEGWFRIKLKLDSAFRSESFGLKGGTWAAADFYIDGKLVSSQGNTGRNGKPFEEYNPYDNPSVPVQLKPGNEYTIAVHFVDYISALPPHLLKSSFGELYSLIRLTGPNYNKIFLEDGVKELTIYSTIWTAICTILSILFWLLYFQNPSEKNLFLIALCSSFIALALFCQYNYNANSAMSFTGFWLYFFVFNICVALVSALMPVVLVRIFKRTLSGWLKILTIIIFTGFIASFMVPPAIGNPLSVCLLAAVLAVSVYLIISSWKNLKGAQWAIVAGVFFSLLWGLLSVTAQTFAVQGRSLYYVLTTGYSLSFPLGLLVYVSLRFKEIINEVRTNAQKVIHLSEEKKDQAIKQQKLLQEEVDCQTLDLRKTLQELKATQQQLIQQEKMASLGELTAGIAHEIQNPLNFVNNFSAINKELLQEMRDEIEKANYEEVKAIASDLEANEEKISHHGKRADSIVKGMLQHAGTSSGEKQPTDINNLAAEYLRLSYQGMRTKDKTFNAAIETDFDTNLGEVNVVAQDIGRVLLNLFNNAFYAVHQKKQQSHEDFKPLVSVSTKREANALVIVVKDNGTGMSSKIADKIFQPFFTTKPTGEGTGLGLSISYDILTKGHGGTLTVHSTEGQGSEFVITLPIWTSPLMPS